MKRKQRKSLPWSRFGYVIPIIIKFGKVLLWFSPRIINALRSYIKHSKECFIRYPITSKLVKKNLAAPRFFNPLLSVWISDETLFLVFDILLDLRKPRYNINTSHTASKKSYTQEWQALYKTCRAEPIAFVNTALVAIRSATQTPSTSGKP